jgi:acetyl-CoA carboxylase carboxyltransferase component
VAAKKTLAEMESAANTLASETLASLFDEESFVELDRFVSPAGKQSSVVTGYGLIDGASVYAFMQDSTQNGGAICETSAAKLKKLYSLAVKNGSPVLGIFDSKGGDIAGGAKTLHAYGDLVKLSTQLSGMVPQIAVVDGLCTGAAAVLASMADFVIMTERSQLFLTPPFVSEDTVEDAGSAQNAAKAGVAAVVESDCAKAIETAKQLLRILPANNLELSGNDYFEQNDTEITASLKGKELVAALADKNSLLELSPDFGTNAYTAFGSINWRTVGFVAAALDGGTLSPNESAKIARFVGFCDAFSIPVVTVIDTIGFVKSNRVELSGGIRDAAKLAQVYAAATTPKIALITGNAIGSAYVALGAGADHDAVFAYENAVIAPVTPKAAAVFLKDKELKEKTPDELADTYAAEEASAFNAAQNGFVDAVITPSQAKKLIAATLDHTSSKRVATPSRKHMNFVF